MKREKWSELLAGLTTAALVWAGPALAQGAGQDMGAGKTDTGAAGTAPQSEADKMNAPGTTGTPPAGATKLKSDLRDDLEKLHAGNQAEIQMGELAVKNAQSEEVKKFGQRMIDDHGKNDQKLTEMAQSMGVSLEGKAFQKKQQDGQKAMKKVEAKTGADFDKAYIDEMVKDHEKDIKDVGKAAKTARKEKQEEIATMLETTQTMMKNHLDEAKQAQKSLKSHKGGKTAGGATGSTGSTGGTGSSGGSTGGEQPGGTRSGGAR